MGMDQEQTPHKRRVRYKGKYPRKFEEKYKEHQPEKYQDMIEHVIRKGKIQRHHRACHPERQHPGRHAYLHYGKGDSGFPEDPAGRDRI